MTVSLTLSALLILGTLVFFGCGYKAYFGIAEKRVWMTNSYYSRIDNPFDYFWFMFFWCFGSLFGAMLSIGSSFALFVPYS